MRKLLVGLVAVVLLAGCGGDDTEGAAPTTDEPRTTVEETDPRTTDTPPTTQRETTTSTAPRTTTTVRPTTSTARPSTTAAPTTTTTVATTPSTARPELRAYAAAQLLSDEAGLGLVAEEDEVAAAEEDFGLLARATLGDWIYVELWDSVDTATQAVADLCCDDLALQCQDIVVYVPDFPPDPTRNDFAIAQVEPVLDDVLGPC